MGPISMAISLSDLQDILYYIFPHLDPDRQLSKKDRFCVRQTVTISALRVKLSFFS